MRPAKPPDRLMAVLLAALSLIPLGIATWALLVELPYFGGQTEIAGHEKAAFLFLTLPTAFGGCLALAAGFLVWRGHRLGRWLAFAWLAISIPVMSLMAIGGAPFVQLGMIVALVASILLAARLAGLMPSE